METWLNCGPLSPVRNTSPEKMKRLAGLSVVALLTGCTSVSEVTPAGDGHYTLTTQVRGGMTPWGEVKASSLKRADDYCRKWGMQMHQIDMQTHGVRGWTPQEAELTFARLGSPQVWVCLALTYPGGANPAHRVVDWAARIALRGASRNINSDRRLLVSCNSALSVGDVVQRVKV
ncbi:hypothetical protein [Paraburkholderia steynii]|uniref:hypothetical protein n=1 Tax=Paraburkholderia steynii TaxID=1245441 RepID=UPI001ABE2CA6|nr:hypothetical protein [Paraburkholderia steynii]